jgi:hypothetical protein
MTKEEQDMPTEFKYSIWDTRTADDQPNINITSAVNLDQIQKNKENPK